ncbi:MAG: hypothetical protein JWO03_3778 [Bacteroidetes bacterium]|nr:hypothetical protein [Bacteroidota bacterium]
MSRKFIPSAVMILLMFTTTIGYAQSKTAASSMTAIELNNSYSSVSDTLYQMGTQWGTVLNEVMTSGEYAKLKPVRAEMEQFIARKQKEIKASPIIGGSEKFKEAMLSFLNFESNMTTKAFMPFEKLTAASKTDEVNAMIANVTTLSKGETDVLAEVQKTQSAYATKNGFAIESTEPAK